MRRYIRSQVPGATYFFTLALENRRSTILADHAPLLREVVQEVRTAWPFAIDAMVVLPDHLHAIWTMPHDDADYPRRWAAIKGGLTKRLVAAGHTLESRGGKGEKVLWQRRFWEHQIRDERDLAHHVDYVHFNPVKHGWVDRAIDWPHSSFHRYVRRGMLPADWGIAGALEGSFGEPEGCS